MDLECLFLSDDPKVKHGLSSSVLRKHHGTDKAYFKSVFIFHHLFSKKVAFGRYLLRHIPLRMVEFLIICCKVTAAVEKRRPPSKPLI